MENKKFAIQETLLVVVLLTFVSGFVDGNTFAFDGGRFAGLQTGNVIQGGIALAKGQFPHALTFAVPFVGFILGVMVNTLVKRRFKNHPRIIFEEVALAIQIAGLSATTLFSVFLNQTIEIGLLSFFMAMQVDSFGKLRGGTVATVFTTGNTKTFASNLMTGISTKDVTALKTAGRYLLVIGGFFVGAFASTWLMRFTHNYTLLVAPVVLLVVWLLIHFNKEAA
ncbi:MAG: DUF1275 domain-containing protein [Lactobacillaceae bacterium]|nr:DUF1275 domain-containing protein [Lactobacillaceae bacterium]